MSDVIRIFKQSSYDGGDPISLVFDSVTEFTPTMAKKVTQYATSDNYSISNNSVKTNPTISMRGRVSYSPVTRHKDNMLDGGGQNILSGRTNTAHDILVTWFDNNDDLFIDVGFKGYSAYQLVSFSPIEDGTESLIFDLKFEKVRRVTYDKITLVQHMSPDLAMDAASNSTKGGGSGNNTSDERTWNVVEIGENAWNYFSKTDPDKAQQAESITRDYRGYYHGNSTNP